MSVVAGRYLVTFPGRVGCHAPQRRIVVYALGIQGPHGHDLYADDSGRLQVEIAADGTVLPVGTDLAGALSHAEPLA
ncbi:DUF6296 family protein [Kitasatospora paranensis]|uniref:DUF6296 family protein n=1 Tax=Kitasatospora paranensis TaxID=258053 RepID=A0ABW2G2M2_9ACTN